MRALGAVLCLLLALLAMPNGNAEVLLVERAYDQGRYWVNETPREYRDIVFQFDPDYYNITGYDNNSIAMSDTSITFDSQDRRSLQVRALEAFANTYVREFRSHLLVNGTDYLNTTTTVDKGGCLIGYIFCSPKWRSCHTFTYAGPAVGNGNTIVTTTGNRTCVEHFSNPDTVLHRMEWSSINEDTRPDLRSKFPTFTYGSAKFSVTLSAEGHGPGIFASDQMGISNLTNYTHAARLVTNAPIFSSGSWGTGDYPHSDVTGIRYAFLNWDGALAAAYEAENGTALTGPTLLDSTLSGIFGGSKTALSFVLGWFPGGQEAAAFLATVITVIIGIPTSAAALFLSAPASFLLYHTVFFVALGIIRYGTSSSADISVIWKTGIVIWRALFQWTLAFARWLYDTAIRLAQAIASNTILLIVTVAAVVGAGVVALLVNVL